MLGSTQAPRFLPNGTKEEEVTFQSKQTTRGFTSLLLVQILLQIILKKSIQLMWYLFFQAQLVTWFSMYDVQLPPNIEIYMTEINQMVNFKLLNPNAMLEGFGIDYTVQELFHGVISAIYKGSLAISQTDSPNVFLNSLQFVMIIALAGLTVLLLKTASMVFKQHKKKIDTFLQKQKE